MLERLGMSRRGSCHEPPLRLLFRFSAVPSEFELQRKLEVALRVGPSKRSIRDHARVRVRAGWIPDERIRLIQVHMCEQVHRFDAELELFAFREAELLEQRGVGPPVLGSAQRVSLQVAKGSDSRFLEHGRIKETGYWSARLGVPNNIWTIGTGIRDTAGVVADVEWQSALDRRVRVELPAA